MNWSEAFAAFKDAKKTMDSTNEIAHNLATMLVGRLRHCGDCELNKLKRELRDYDIRTGTWRK